MAIFTSYRGQSLPLYEGATQLLTHPVVPLQGDWRGTLPKKYWLCKTA